MARYILLDEKKITRLKSEAQRFQDDIVCAVGTDFMQNIAEAENKMIFDILKGLEDEPAADVAPKSEVAREIFEDIASKQITIVDHVGTMGVVVLIKDIFELKKKYTGEQT